MYENKIRDGNGTVSFARESEFTDFMSELNAETQWLLVDARNDLKVYPSSTAVPYGSGSRKFLCGMSQWDEMVCRGGLYVEFTDTCGDDYIAPLWIETSMLTLQERAFIKSKLACKYLYDEAWSNMAELMNEGFSYMGAHIKLLVRGGWIHAGHTKRYSVLEQETIFNAAKEHVDGNFPNGRFQSASFNHDLTSVEYRLCDGSAPLMTAYAAAWTASGMPSGLLAKTFPVLEYSTSDTGRYQLTIRPELRIGTSVYPLGTPVEAKHYSAALRTTIDEKSKMAFAAMQDGLTEIASMISIKLNHPWACFVRVCSAIGLTKVAKGCCIEALQQMKDFYEEDEVTAFDVYKSICEITLFPSFKDLASGTQFSVRECFNRILTVKWPNLDRTGSEEI